MFWVLWRGLIWSGRELRKFCIGRLGRAGNHRGIYASGNRGRGRGKGRRKRNNWGLKSLIVQVEEQKGFVGSGTEL